MFASERKNSEEQRATAEARRRAGVLGYYSELNPGAAPEATAHAKYRFDDRWGIVEVGPMGR